MTRYEFRMALAAIVCAVIGIAVLALVLPWPLLLGQLCVLALIGVAFGGIR